MWKKTAETFAIFWPLMFSAPLLATEGTEVINGVRWNYAEEDGEAVVWLEEGSALSPTSSVLTVPAFIAGFPVKRFGRIEYSPPVFTSLVIEEGIASIEDFACYDLAYSSITIPNTVTNIGVRAFDGCANLDSVVIPDSVINLGFGAFTGSGLNAVVLGKGIERLPNALFDSCGALSSIAIPANVKDIGIDAFGCCSSLQSVIIPDSVTNISSFAFSQCESLAFVSIGSGVRSIGEAAFDSCSKLTSVVIPDGVVFIGDHAFQLCARLEEVSLGNGLDRVADGMFYQCSSLKSVTFGTGLKSIGLGAFCYCSQLEEVVLPAGLRSIAELAFRRCEKLKRVVIPSSVTSVGGNAFQQCWELEDLTIPGNLKAYDYFYQSSAVDYIGLERITNVVVSLGTTTIANGMLSGCSNLARLTIPPGVTNIGERAFATCRSLAVCVLPESVKSIGANAFKDCDGMLRLYLPGHLSGQTEELSIPPTCEVIFYGPLLPETSFSPVPIPLSWLFRHGLALDGDCDLAVAALAANGSNAVWECYVCGIDPTDANAKFEVRIDIRNGVPTISWTPDLSSNYPAPSRLYTVEGKANLSDEWAATNSASRFFRVRVSMP